MCMPRLATLLVGPDTCCSDERLLWPFVLDFVTFSKIAKVTQIIILCSGSVLLINFDIFSDLMKPVWSESRYEKQATF